MTQTVSTGEVEWEESDWERLVEQIRLGDCTPFLGAGTCSDTRPDSAVLGRTWADEHDYPFSGEARLPEVMQYVSVLARDPVTVKQRVTRQLTAHAEPDFADPVEPHTLLARFPMQVYLTTNYDDYMTRALVRVNKRPVTAVCPWYPGGEDDTEMAIPADYQPHTEAPLVYHLHGSFREASSMVLAEQDYVEFLIKLAKDIGGDTRKVVPIHIMRALTRQPLLFLGYSLNDWSFRMLFHGCLAAVGDVQQRRHVSVQLTPEVDGHDVATRQRAESYLRRYFAKFNISVFWGTAGEFCTELHNRLPPP